MFILIYVLNTVVLITQHLTLAGLDRDLNAALEGMPYRFQEVGLMKLD